MSDDIVTRLRQALETDESILLTMPRPTVQMMADEIERLRAEVSRLGSFIHPIGTVVHDKAVRDDES